MLKSKKSFFNIKPFEDVMTHKKILNTFKTLPVYARLYIAGITVLVLATVLRGGFVNAMFVLAVALIFSAFFASSKGG